MEGVSRKMVFAISLLAMSGLLMVASPVSAEEVEAPRDGDVVVHVNDDVLPSALRPQTQDRRVNICNQTNFKVWTARAGLREGQFVTRGWYGIENGECRELVAQYLFVYRDGDFQKRWFIGLDRRTMCVRRGNAFVIFRPDQVSVCNELERGTRVPFARVPTGTGTFTWRLQPQP